MMKLRVLATTLGALMALASGTVSGHAVINEGTAVAGSFTFVTLRITHGCGESATREVRVTIPEGVTRVSSRFEEHWSFAKQVRKLDEPIMAGGEAVTEVVEHVVWSGGTLPDGYYGEFQLRAMMPNEPGRVLWFKTVQVCDDGELRWDMIPAQGQNPYALEMPSPFLKLVENN